MKTRLLGTLTAVVAVAALIFTLVPGCEDDPSMDDTDRYFAEHPYITDPRGQTFESGLKISPESATPDYIGQKIIFTASGGEPPYDWGVANANGTIAHNNSRDRATATYTVVGAGANGDNAVIVSDEDGRAAIADIGAAAAGTLTITPTLITIGTGQSVNFFASGGVPTYNWNVVIPTGSQGGGTMSAATGASSQYTADVASVGTNTVVLTDNNNNQATATVIQL